MPAISDIISFLIKTLLYRRAVTQARKKGLLFYLKTLQVVRQSTTLLLVAFALFQLMLFGFVGVVVAGIFLYPEDLQWKLWALLTISGVLFLGPLVFLFFIFSERVWYKISGAEKMMSDNS